MRPPEFTGGNLRIVRVFVSSIRAHRFNEAAGIHRRKLAIDFEVQIDDTIASMRPPEFTGGNTMGA